MTSRRQFLRMGRRLAASGIALMAVPSALNTIALAADQGIPARKQARTVAAWMAEWMQAARAPGGVLHLSRFKDPIYFLTRPGVGWKPNAGQERYQPVEVPVGFVTDFTSIPRVFWSLLRPDGEYTYPAIVHDWMYWTQERPREEADEIFRLGMQDFAIDGATVATIYNAVRLGGGTAWRGNARLKEGGERRILKVFPDDPRIRWSEWKRRPEVFK